MNCRKMPQGRGAEVKMILRPPALSSLRVIKQERTPESCSYPRAIFCARFRRSFHLLQPTCLTDGEACSDTAHPCLSYPKQFRQTTCAWEDSAVWAAPHLRRKAGTWELPEPWQASPAFQ